MKNYVIYLLIVSNLSCNKLIDIPPSNSFIQRSDLINTEIFLESYATALYSKFCYLLNNDVVNKNYTVVLGSLADEFFSPNVIQNQVIRNAYLNNYFTLNSSNSDYDNPQIFIDFLKFIIECNTALSILNESKFTNFERVKLEIKALRSITYYYLVYVYDDLPLLISEDYNHNFQIPVSEFNEIIKHCISELEDVYNKIDNKKLNLKNVEIDDFFTIRVNKDVVSYYLSLLYLQVNEFELSAKHSLEIISKYNLEENVNWKFKLQSSDNIWITLPSEPLSITFNNNPSATFLNYKLLPTSLIFNSTSRFFSLSKFLIESFDNNDKRLSEYIDKVVYNDSYVYLAYKYKIPGPYNSLSNEKPILIRLPLVFYNLIEAYIHMNKTVEAIELLKQVNQIYFEEFLTYDDINIDIYLKERFKESFSEFGDRWISLKRNNLIDSIMSIALPLKSSGQFEWNINKRKLPIPLSQKNLNPNL